MNANITSISYQKAIKTKAKLRVLAFHSVNDSMNFKKIVEYLKNNYNIISIHQLMDFFDNKIQLPPKALLITSDDGDRSILNNAVPIFKTYNVPAVIFVITGLIDSFTPFWWDEIVYYLGKERGHKKVREVKTWSNEKRINFLKGLRGTNEDSLKKPQLTKEELMFMKNEGIAIGGHSHTHPMFDKCSELELNEEMVVSTEILKKLKLDDNIFAYPNGNYSLTSEKILKFNDIKLAFLFDHKINFKLSDPLRISRLVVNDTTPIWKLKLILSGIHSNILPYSKLWSKIKHKIFK